MSAVAKLLADVTRERLKDGDPHHNTGSSPRSSTPFKAIRADSPGAVGNRTKPAKNAMTGMKPLCGSTACNQAMSIPKIRESAPAKSI
jgi:hypothetical protein